MQWRLILTLGLMVIVVIFTLANAHVVRFNYIINESDVSLALVIIVSALIGSIAGVVASLSSQLRLKQQLVEKEQKIRTAKREQTNLTDEQDMNKRRPRRP